MRYFRNFKTEGVTVVGVRGANVSDFYGVSLSGGNLLINRELNLDIKEAHELRRWWVEEGGKDMETTSITVQGGRAGGADGERVKMVAEVKMENLGRGAERGEYYTLVGITTYFSKVQIFHQGFIFILFRLILTTTKSIRIEPSTRLV